MAAADLLEPAVRGQHRVLLADELYQHYTNCPVPRRRRSWRRRLRFVRKKYAWLVLVGGAGILKRAIDLSGALIGLLVLAPLFLLVGALIKLTDNGPVLFWQFRVGRWGREFPFPKFRSMVPHADQMKDDLLKHNHHGECGVTFKIKDDPRITWIGRIIRKGSIDELPQLWCVLKGDMSLVGPRPPLPREVERYTLAERRRLDVLPGLTCFWQVQGRSEIPFPQQVQLDVQYIESQSLWLDIKLLLLTVPAVLFGRGAY
jgi:lipopolysaccharide/colanic/teichoic acid biosynthesis glycosyltransferase